MLRLLALVAIIYSCPTIHCKTVVFLPFGITSHTRHYGIVAQELVKSGHQSWLAVPSAFEKRKADFFPGVNILSYKDFMVDQEESWVHKFESSGFGDIPNWEWVLHYEDTLSNIYFQAMYNGHLIEFIKGLKPDLIVIDFYPRINEFVAIPYKLGVPFAVLSCLHNEITERIPYNPLADAYNSENFRSHAGLFEQLVTISSLMYPMFHDIFFDRGYISKIAPERPDIATNELIAKAEVFIIESDFVLEYPRPLLPNIKYVGGLTAGPSRELSEPFKSFVERSEKEGVGVAIFSLGSLFLNLSPNKEAMFMAAMGKVNFNVIWRANFTSPDPKKILTSTWVPQNDILGHPNTKVFISHCGLHSQYEALYHAVPVVCMPLFFDQEFNTERAVNKGLAQAVDYTKTTAEELASVINDVATNHTIRSTVKKASEIYRSLYKDPGREAAFWLDHVMKYGGSYMRYTGQQMPMYQFAMIYFLLFGAGIVTALIVLLVVLTLCWLLRRCFRSKKHLKKD